MGKKTLKSQQYESMNRRDVEVTYTTVIIAAANVANDELTADSELARLLSMVSISYRLPVRQSTVCKESFI